MMSKAQQSKKRFHGVALRNLCVWESKQYHMAGNQSFVWLNYKESLFGHFTWHARLWSAHEHGALSKIRSSTRVWSWFPSRTHYTYTSGVPYWCAWDSCCSFARDSRCLGPMVSSLESIVSLAPLDVWLHAKQELNGGWLGWYRCGCDAAVMRLWCGCVPCRVDV